MKNELITLGAWLAAFLAGLHFSLMAAVIMAFVALVVVGGALNAGSAGK